MARKGRARRFREARQLKQGYDDGLFAEGSGTLADVADSDADSDTDTDTDAESTDDDFEDDYEEDESDRTD